MIDKKEIKAWVNAVWIFDRTEHDNIDWNGYWDIVGDDIEMAWEAAMAVWMGLKEAWMSV